MESREESKHEDIDNRMRLSHEMSKFFKKAYNMFGDPEAIIGKNLTTTTYWFYLDSLFFNNDKNEDVKAEVRKYEKMHTHEFDELEDLEFILKIRKLVSEEKMGTLNLCDIRSTSIDETINILECHSQKIQNENNSLLDQLKIKEAQEKNKLYDQLKVFNVKPRECHPMFVYEEFESELRNRWKIEDKRMENKDKCFLCSKPNKLITCNSCSLKVHPSCYPSLTHRFDSKINKPTEEELKSFICENCVNKVNPETQKCELCCCIGGNFVKLDFEPENEEEHYDFKFLKENQVENGNKTPHSTHLELKVKYNQESSKEASKFVHLTCFIWNTDLKWNEEENLAGGLEIIGKRKHHGICSLCGISLGSAIPCSNEACRRFYHGECAKRNGLEMNLIRAKTSVIELFCERHRHLNRYESIEEASINKFREVKKMFDGVDKEIKRLHVTASYQQVKLVVERDYCSVCGKEEGREKTTICKQCRKWYHHGCSSNCKNCA